MSRVLLMCGPAGSGKTTYARALEQEGFTRLSLDEEAWQRGHRSHPLPGPTTAALERDLRARLTELLHAGRDVVIDMAFCSRAARDRYRDLSRSCGADAQTVYFATPRHVVLERVRARDGATANDAKLPDELVAAYFDGFDVPTADEGPLQVIPFEHGGGA